MKRPDAIATRWLRLAVAASFAGGYSAFSLVRHAQLGTAAYDLGIFDQAVQRYAAGQAPIVELKGPGFNLLGDHFHPVLMVLAPIYRAFPDARTLLVAQALIVASSLLPLGRLAMTRLGLTRGLAVMVACGLSWGLAGLIAFDFHEVCFAVPLVAWAAVALVERRWWPAAAWTAPLLLVKEDLGATVVAVGIYLLLHKQRRPGISLVAGGVASAALITLVVLPAINTGGSYRYWKTLGATESDRSFLVRLLLLPAKLVTPAPKFGLLVLLIVTTGVLSLRSPILALAVPTLGWRFLSDNPLYWSTGVVHYNAILMPIGFVALIDAIDRVNRCGPEAQRRLARGAPAGVLLVALVWLPRTPLWQAADGRVGQPPGRVRAAHRLLDQIPDGALVSASGYLAPQLVDRTRVVLFPNTHPQFAPDWVVVDSLELRGVPLPSVEQERAFALLRNGGAAYDVSAEQEGYVLFQRRDDVARGTYFERATQSWAG